MTRRRAAQPTAAARTRRKPGVHLAFGTDPLPAARDYGAHGPALRRVVALARVTAPVDQARRYLLQTIARLAPQALEDLRTATCDINPHHRAAMVAAVRAWAHPVGLDVPWMHIVATNTLALWRVWPSARGRRWDMNLRNIGMIVPTRGRLPRRPAELLIRADHVEWLVRRRVLGQKYAEITTPPETARKAVRALAPRLGL